MQIFRPLALLLLFALSTPDSWGQSSPSAWGKGKLAYYQGDLDSTVYWMRQAAEAFYQREEWDSLTLAYQWAATLSNYKQDFDLTAELSRECLARVPIESYMVVRLLMILGYAQENQGNILEAYQTYEQAYLMALRQGYDDAVLAGYLYRPLANLATRLGEFSRALILLKKWHQRVKNQPDQVSQAQEAINDICLVWLSMEQPDSVMAILAQAPSGGTTTSQGLLALRRAEAELDMGVVEGNTIVEAIHLLEQSMPDEQPWQQNARISYLAQALKIQGQVYQQQHQRTQAEGAYLSALALVQKGVTEGRPHRAAGKLQLERARMALEQGDSARARQLVEAGLCILTGYAHWQQAADSVWAENTFVGLFEVLAQSYAPSSDSVRWALEKALEAGDALWENLRHESAHFTQSKVMHRIYGQLIAFHFAVGTPSAYREALAVHGRHQAAVLRGQLARVQQLQSSPEGERLLQLERRLLASLALPEVPTHIRYAWSAAYDTLQEYIAQKVPIMTVPEVPTASAVQAWLQGETPTSGAIVYAWHEELQILFGWSLTADTLKAAQWPLLSLIPPLEQLDSLLTQPQLARDQPAQTLDGYLKAGYAVFDLLVAPLLDAKATQWVVVPDGPLQRLPFEALPTRPQASNWASVPYWVLQSPVSYLPALWWWLHPPSPSDQAEGLGAFAANYPQGVGIAPLPFADREIQAVAEKFAGVKKEAATESDFVQNASQYEVLHLAMHAFTYPEEPQRSGLQFTQSGDSAYDDFLYLGELLALDLKAQLVTLSACNTGQGPLLPGEGPLSLARYFMVAGAGGVTMSLWRVPDRETAQLMQAYYEALAQGRVPAQALQAAKTQFLQHVPGDHWSHPYYWAGFVHSGLNLPLTQKSHPAGWLLIVMILPVIGGGWFWYRSRRART